ncbi:MAG: phosphopantetheine-binding protein [Proteobacteria bacterium]|jgi:acyl carrier protein|nr:phosphopantetheine-binding protein [Pseudomonadota bacterium]
MDAELKRRIDERAEVLRVIKSDLITRLNLPYEPEDLHEDVSLLGSGLGLDSLDALEVILGVEHSFDVKIADDNIAILRSINSIADYVLAERARKKGEVA